MDDAGHRGEDPQVPLSDAAIAAEIARAATRGRGSDRVPTLEQLLSAFGEREPTDEARRRVRAALQVAGVRVKPDLLTAPPGERVVLVPPGASAPTRGRAVLGLVALVAVVAVAAIAAGIAGKGSNDRASTLPETTTTATPLTPAPGATTTTAPEAPQTTPTAATTPATTDPATTTQTTPSDTAAAAADRRRARAAQLRRDRRQAAARARAPVTVRVDATAQPTFLCVEDGTGRQLFGGTLSGRQTFRAQRVRLNIGLASARVTVNGKPVPLPGSPAGLDITRKGGARPLPLGQRPCG